MKVSKRVLGLVLMVVGLVFMGLAVGLKRADDSLRERLAQKEKAIFWLEGERAKLEGQRQELSNELAERDLTISSLLDGEARKAAGSDGDDKDRDGTSDRRDRCPDEPGPFWRLGCPPPPDRDGDRVADYRDRCPDEPAPFWRWDGCPPSPDGDGDGVADEKDRCPDEPGWYFNRGCPLGKR